MDVTRFNFRDTCLEVEKAISEASFIAMDGEFSGVTNSSFAVTHYDSPEERYHKLKHNVGDFLLMQYGLAIFKWDNEKEEHIVDAYNFYIFPFRSSSSGIPDRIFSCQSSSIDFLAAQNFDFNKVFHSGIPYLRPGEEVALRNAVNEKHALRMQNFKSPRKSFDSNGVAADSTSPAGSPTVVSDPKTQAFVDDVKKKIDEFLKTSKQGESLNLEPCNSYLRKILYERIPTMFPEPLVLEAQVNERTRQRFLVVSRAGDQQAMEIRKQQAKAKDDSDLQDAVGFSRIIQMLSQSQKLIVGHNILLDLIFTLHQFVCLMPSTLEEFKSAMTCLFPKLIDTKLMGSMLPFRELIPSTALGEMHSRLSNSPFSIPDIVPPEKYNPSKSDHDMNLNLHEAAYDAYITGVSFLSMLNFLSSFRKQGKNSLANPATEIISPYLNKVFLMRSPDIPYLNLAGSDLTPCREHVFHVQFPPTWRAVDIRALFAPAGTAINISWINDTQCFVGLHNKAQAKQVKKLIMKPTGLESNYYTVRTYEEYQREMAGQIFVTSPYMSRPQVPYSRNKVWRPNNGHTSAPKTPTPSTSFTTTMANAKILTSTDEITSAKSSPASRKRSGEESMCTNNTQSRRTSSGSNVNLEIGSRDLDEPDVKRPRSQESSETDVQEQENPPVAMAVAQTDIPALLVSNDDSAAMDNEDEIEENKDQPKVPSAFEVPATWG